MCEPARTDIMRRACPPHLQPVRRRPRCDRPGSHTRQSARRQPDVRRSRAADDTEPLVSSVRRRPRCADRNRTRHRPLMCLSARRPRCGRRQSHATPSHSAPSMRRRLRCDRPTRTHTRPRHRSPSTRRRPRRRRPEPRTTPSDRRYPARGRPRCERSRVTDDRARRPRQSGDAVAARDMNGTRDGSRLTSSPRARRRVVRTSLGSLP